MKRRMWILLSLVVGVLTAGAVQADHHEVLVTVENLAPEGGAFFTPVWVGLHDGSFNLFDPGGLASEGLERLAEDGDASVLRADFAGATGAGMDAMVTAPEGFAGAPVFDPGDKAYVMLTAMPGKTRYLSFASMVIPSNDAFIGNHKPMAIEIYDTDGQFKGKQIITILGSMVWDAGTELNTEMDAAFINQTDPDTGMMTMCPVLPHPGFLGSYANPGSDPIILGGMGPGGIVFDPVAADFSLPYAVVARITIELAPANGMPDEGSAMVSALGRPDNGRQRPVVYVTSQELYYDSIVTTDLPPNGPFQKLEMGPNGLQTEFGPGDPGYVGGRWWVDANGNGEMDAGDRYFGCPLLPPGREEP